MYNAKIKNSKGFTLVEILIASSIFVMVIIAAIAAFGSATGLQIQVDTARLVSEAGRFPLEEISRQAKMASSWQDTTGTIHPAFEVLNNGNDFPIYQVVRSTAGEPQKIIRRRYFLDGNVLKVTVAENSTLASGDWPEETTTALTSANQAVISTLTFEPTSQTPTQQPYVKISYDIEAPQRGTKPIEKAKIELQTQITSRDYSFQDIQGIKVIQ